MQCTTSKRYLPGVVWRIRKSNASCSVSKRIACPDETMHKRPDWLIAMPSLALLPVLVPGLPATRNSYHCDSDIVSPSP